MRDLMSWSFPVFRVFGIQVRLHLFFIIIVLGLVLRQWFLTQYQNVSGLDILLMTVVVLFVSVLLHEFGHCFGARYVGGDAREILIWPLGGLAYTEVPHRWRALFTTVAAGPAVNVLICVTCVVAVSSAGFVPNLNPTADPHFAEMRNTNGRVYTSDSGVRLYWAGTNDQPNYQEVSRKFAEYEKRHDGKRVPSPADDEKYAEAVAEMGFERALAPWWVVWAYRIFWINWLLFLFNLIPAYPLDGGQLLQSLIWARTDYRRGVVVASVTGIVFAVIFVLVSIAANEALFLGLALFMLYSASMKRAQLDAEEGPFGYDFSAGYTSLEKDDEAPPPPPRPGFFRRWRDARRARKAAREAELRMQEEARVDELLEKIARSGKASLTPEEQKFLERISARKRNTS